MLDMPKKPKNPIQDNLVWPPARIIVRLRERVPLERGFTGFYPSRGLCSRRCVRSLLSGWWMCLWVPVCVCNLGQIKETGHWGLSGPTFQGEYPHFVTFMGLYFTQESAFKHGSYPSASRNWLISNCNILSRIPIICTSNMLNKYFLYLFLRFFS